MSEPHEPSAGGRQSTPLDPTALLAAAPDALVATDAAGTIVLAGGALRAVLGWDPVDLAGHPLAEVLPGGPPRGAGPERARARRRDGGEVEVEVTAAPAASAGQVLALRAAAPAWHPIEAAGLGTWEWAPGAGLRGSPRARALLGAAGAPPTTDLLAALHPDDRPAVEAALAAASDPAREGDRVVEEARVIDPDDPAPGARGRWVALRGRAAPTGDAPRRVEGTVLDVTDARRAAADARFLAEAGRQLARSLDYDVTLRRVARLAVPYLADYCVVDLLEEGRGPPRLVAAAHVDRAAEATVRELRARHPFDPAAPYGVARVIRTGEPDRQTIDEPWLDAFAGGDPARRRTVEELALTSYMVLPLAVRGRLLGAVSFVAAESRRRYDEEHQDLGEELARRIALAIDNARLYREAQEAIRARDEFLSIASHELRTPLTPLRLQVQALRRALATPDRFDPRRLAAKLEGKLEMMERQVDRLGALVANLLDISRLAAHRLDLRLEALDLRAVVEDAVARARDDARRSGVELRLAAGPPLRGRWDRVRLEQVVANLLSNAVKYGAGAPVDVEVLAGPGAEEARLVVRDRGIGIAPEDQRRIFQRFERAVSERHYGGFGLGLWIGRQVVEAMGGTIEVESAIGQGATFTVRLPLAPAGR